MKNSIVNILNIRALLLKSAFLNGDFKNNLVNSLGLDQCIMVC